MIFRWVQGLLYIPGSAMCFPGPPWGFECQCANTGPGEVPALRPHVAGSSGDGGRAGGTCSGTGAGLAGAAATGIQGGRRITCTSLIEG